MRVSLRIPPDGRLSISSWWRSDDRRASRSNSFACSAVTMISRSSSGTIMAVRQLAARFDCKMSPYVWSPK